MIGKKTVVFIVVTIVVTTPPAEHFFLLFVPFKVMSIFPFFFLKTLEYVVNQLVKYREDGEVEYWRAYDLQCLR